MVGSYGGEVLLKELLETQLGLVLHLLRQAKLPELLGFTRVGGGAYSVPLKGFMGFLYIVIVLGFYRGLLGFDCGLSMTLQDLPIPRHEKRLKPGFRPFWASSSS